MSIDAKLKELYSPEELEKLERMKSLTNQAYTYSQKFFEDRARHWARYKNELGIEKADWQADIANPLPHLAVIRKASFCTDAVLGSAGRPIFRALPWDNINSARKAMAHTAFIKKQQSDMPLTEILYNSFVEEFVVGTSILHTYWEFETEKILRPPVPKLMMIKEPAINPITGQQITDPYTGEPVFTRRLGLEPVAPPPEIIVRKDRPGIEQVDLNSFWPDPMARDIDSGSFHVRQRFMKLSELYKMAELGRFPKERVDLVKDNTFLIRRDLGKSAQRRFGRYAHFHDSYSDRVYQYSNIDKDDPVCEVLEFYEPGKVSLLVNGDVPLDLDRANYYSKYPFTRFANLPQNNEFFGMSEFQVTERLLDASNQMQNMIFDNWEKHLKGITLVEGSISDISLRQLEEGNPGDVIRVSDINGIKTERPDLMDNSVISGMSLLLQQVKDALTVDGAISGTSPGSEVRDSQSFEIFTRISQVTLSITVRRITESLRDLGRQWLNLNKQFLTMPFKIKIAGANALDTAKTEEQMIDPNNIDDMPGNMDVDVQLSTIADARIDRELKRMAEAINMAQGSPRFKAEDALIEMFSKIDSFSDAISFFETDPAEVIKRAQLNAYAAGKKSPVIAGRYQPQGGNGGGAPVMANAGSQGQPGQPTEQ